MSAGRRLLRSEVINVRVTPTAWTLLFASMAMAGGSLSANLAVVGATEMAEEATLQQAMHASTVATLTFALVAGLVVATSDYRFGRIDQILLSAPQPGSVLVAKSSVGLGLGVLYGLVGSAVALVVLRAFASVRGVTVDLTSAVVIEPLVGVVIGGGLFAMLGVGAGTAIRNQPAAIAGGMVLLLVVQPPMLLGAPAVGRWLPGAAGLSLTASPGDDLIDPMAGAGVLLAWTVMAGLAGWRRLQVHGAG